jgi:hypothetical protein
MVTFVPLYFPSGHQTWLAIGHPKLSTNGLFSVATLDIDGDTLKRNAFDIQNVPCLKRQLH